MVAMETVLTIGILFAVIASGVVASPLAVVFGEGVGAWLGRWEGLHVQDLVDLPESNQTQCLLSNHNTLFISKVMTRSVGLSTN